jgi:hypothetical protein
MHKLGMIIAREFREMLPATILFLFLFHMIALTKAAMLNDFSITALRATSATLGALLVGKAILIMEALPLVRISSSRLLTKVLLKTVLYGTVVIVFKFIEELIPLLMKHEGVLAALQAMLSGIVWPVFGVLALWICGGLILYSLASELGRAIGRDRVKEILFSRVKSVP